MVENVLVGKLYTIDDHTKWYDDRTNETDLVDNYTAMAELLTSSAKKHVVGLDRVQIDTGTAPDIRSVFKDHFAKIYETWKSGANVLYCDLDVVFLDSYRVFPEDSVQLFPHFSMFNYTDPPRTRDQHYGLQFDHYFNCGIRYYPSTMSEEIWEYGFDLLENWNPDRWDAEQIIYNAMMWKQPISKNDVYRPDLSWQMLAPTPKSDMNHRFNQLDVAAAAAVHVHGSRGSGNRLETMRSLVNGNFGDDVLLL